jgi:hypothetical protein
MPQFRVALERLARTEDGPRNPFLISDIFSPRWRRSVLVREWVMDADDEAHVRRLLDEARAMDVPGVREFNLRSIERIEATPSEGERLG